MKVIAHGITENDNLIINITCPRCLTEFEFEKWEAYKMTQKISTISCPDCKTPISFDGNLLLNQVDKLEK